MLGQLKAALEFPQRQAVGDQRRDLYRAALNQRDGLWEGTVDGKTADDL